MHRNVSTTFSCNGEYSFYNLISSTNMRITRLRTIQFHSYFIETQIIIYNYFVVREYTGIIEPNHRNTADNHFRSTILLVSTILDKNDNIIFREYNVR